MDDRHAAYLDAHRRRWAREAAEHGRRAEVMREAAHSIAGLCRAFGAQRVILFGSAVHGRMRPHSDLDIAVQGVPPRKFFELYGKVLDVSPVSVDLVDLEDAAESLRRRIETEGIEL